MVSSGIEANVAVIIIKGAAEELANASIFPESLTMFAFIRRI